MLRKQIDCYALRLRKQPVAAEWERGARKHVNPELDAARLQIIAMSKKSQKKEQKRFLIKS